MAKKSNKTEHVLKLITKNDDAAQDDDYFVMDQEISENGTSAIRNAVQPKPEENPGEIKFKPKDSIPVQTASAGIEIEASAAAVQHKAPAVPQEAPTVRAFREQENAGSALLEQNDDLINIAEILAREKLALVMERMKVCTCKTCVNDVLALALNSLPTKYVTTDAGRQYFQLDVYKKQYETDILAALTKACVRVKASPRH
jgi:hypothetical protein